MTVYTGKEYTQGHENHSSPVKREKHHETAHQIQNMTDSLSFSQKQTDTYTHLLLSETTIFHAFLVNSDYCACAVVSCSNRGIPCASCGQYTVLKELKTYYAMGGRPETYNTSWSDLMELNYHDQQSIGTLSTYPSFPRAFTPHLCKYKHTIHNCSFILGPSL